jgi:hypothetical protein
MMLAAAGLRPARAAPAPTPDTGTVHYADVAGWYQRTPDEVAVVSPFDWSMASLPASLPYSIGPWRGEDRPPDPDVQAWFGDPDVTIERTYTRADGALVWLSAFGSRGDKSFHLFEHTPETCYPLSGWQIARLERQGIDLGPRPLTVNAGAATNPHGDSLAFLYVYVWDAPARDPARGLVSLRIAAPSPPAGSAEDAALLAEAFLAELFTTTLNWSAF